MILAFCGKKRCGKDTAAQEAIKVGFTKLSFAESLKRMCSEFTELPLELFTEDEYKDAVLKTPIVIGSAKVNKLLECINKVQPLTEQQTEQILYKVNSSVYETPRKLLQFIGTDICRDIVGKDFWINYIKPQITGKVVFTDCRMPNEREFLKSLGATLVRIYRPDTDKLEDSHFSENNLGGDSEYDVLMYNDEGYIKFRNEVSLWILLRRF